MRTKYLVICVNDSQDICSVDPFDTEKDARKFLTEDAARVYDEIEHHNDSSIEVCGGLAEVVDGDTVYRWSIFPMVIK